MKVRGPGEHSDELHRAGSFWKHTISPVLIVHWTTTGNAQGFIRWFLITFRWILDSRSRLIRRPNCRFNTDFLPSISTCPVIDRNAPPGPDWLEYSCVTWSEALSLYPWVENKALYEHWIIFFSSHTEQIASRPRRDTYWISLKKKKRNEKSSIIRLESVTAPLMRSFKFPY